MGMRPALWAASTRSVVPVFPANMPISPMGCMVPVTLEQWEMTTRRVSRRRAASTSRGLMKPCLSQGILVISAPIFCARHRGRITELCSMDDVMTCPPPRSIPRIAMLRPAVALDVKAILDASTMPNSSASVSRASKRIRVASIPRL